MKKTLISILVATVVVSSALFYSCSREVAQPSNNQSQVGDGGNNNNNNTNNNNNNNQNNVSYGPLDLVITEINWGGSYDSSGSITNGEFVEIMNNTTNTINLGGFQLRYDGGGSFTNKRVTLPSTLSLAPGEFLVVFITNRDHNPYSLVVNTGTYKRFLWSGINYIGDNGFRIAIISPSGDEIDFVETRSGRPGQVPIRGSLGTPKKTMERVLPFISGTNASAWDEAVSNVNYVYGGANNLGTPGASNSVWFVYATISLVQPVDGASINKSNTNVVFSWSVSGGRGYSSYIFRITSNDVVLYSTNTSVNSNVVDVSGLEVWNGYEWFVLGVSGGVTNSSATNTFEIVTTGGGSGGYNPLDLVITEINWGGSYSSDTSATTNGEFVEIMNNTSSPINLAGFQLRYDGGGGFTNKRVTLPSIVLNPGEFLVAFITNDSYNPYALVMNTNTYKTFLWSGIRYIANTGFRVAIISPSGDEIDFVETRNGQPGEVPIRGSSGTVKKTMERVLPFVSGTNADAWDEAVSNVNYVYGSANNLGTPGASNSVWFVFKTISLSTPANNTTLNKATLSTQNFVWTLTGSSGSGYPLYLLVFTTNNQLFTNILVNSTNTNINIISFPVESYKWFVLGVSGSITNSSANTNTLVITNFGNISLTSPSDNDIHNTAIEGNNINFSWSYNPSGSLHVANVYLLDSSDNPVRSNMNVSSTSSSIDISSLPYGDYKWYVLASNTNSALVVYSTTNNIKITNYASVGLTSPLDNYTNNIVENGTTISFSWVYSPANAFNQASVYVLDNMNNIVASGIDLTTTSWSADITTSGVYRWYVLATNTSTGSYSYSSTNTLYVTNFGSISLVSHPTNNHRHNILLDGNSIALSWSYTPSSAFNQATVYILNARNNNVVMSVNVNTTSSSIDVSSLPSGRYRWFVMATNTTYGISAYTPTNNIGVYRISNIYSGVFFSEIGWGGFRTTGSMSDGEFIEIYNTNSYDINLNGWTVSYVNNSYSLGSVRHWSITNDIIIKSNSLVVFLNKTTNTNYIQLDNIETYDFMFEATNGAIANSGFVLWLWNISNGHTNISDHVIATTSKTNTFYISNLPPLFSTNGGFVPFGTPGTSSIASTMVRTNFIYDPTNANRSWFSNSTVSNLKNGAEVNTRATPGVLLY